jgi:xylose isomerase
MKIRHSLMPGYLGRVADKFHEYQSAKTLVDKLNDVRKVKNADGIEIVYPSDFSNVNETIKILKESGLAVSAVNLNVKSQKHWQNGSFTNPDPKLREKAASELKTAMDLAVELDTDMVTCCPLIDGHNFHFEVDYLNQWGWLEEGFREGVKHRSDIKISLEYKINESRNMNILSDMGRTLYLCECIKAPNIGVTMDVGHSLIARESPAEVMTIAANAGRLFYMHFNDNDRFWDWDMVPGTVNFWDLIEVIYYLEKLEWEGWFSYDVMTRDGNQVETMSASIDIVNIAQKYLHKIGLEKINDLIINESSANTFRYLFESIL